MVISYLGRKLLAQPVFQITRKSPTISHQAIYRLSSKYSHPIIKIYLESIDENHLTIAEALSQRISNEFKEYKVEVLPTDAPSASKDAPFTVIINDKTLEIGIIGLQHFNPTIREEIHVSNLKSRLLFEFGLEKTKS